MLLLSGRHSQNIAGGDVFRKMEMEKSCDQFGRRRQRLVTLTEETASIRRRDDNRDVSLFPDNDSNNNNNKIRADNENTVTPRRGNVPPRNRERRAWDELSDGDNVPPYKPGKRETEKSGNRDASIPRHRRSEERESTKENRHSRRIASLPRHDNDRSIDEFAGSRREKEPYRRHAGARDETRDIGGAHNRSRASSLGRRLEKPIADENRRKTSTSRRPYEAVDSHRHAGEHDRSRSLPRGKTEDDRRKPKTSRDVSPSLVADRHILTSRNDGSVVGRDRRRRDEPNRHRRRPPTALGDSDSEDSIQGVARVNRISVHRGRDLNSSDDDDEDDVRRPTTKRRVDDRRDRVPPMRRNVTADDFTKRRDVTRDDDFSKRRDVTRDDDFTKRRDVTRDDEFTKRRDVTRDDVTLTERFNRTKEQRHDELPDRNERLRGRERQPRLIPHDDARRREKLAALDTSLDALRDGTRVVEEAKKNVYSLTPREQAVEEEKNKLRALDRKLNGREEKQHGGLAEESNHFSLKNESIYEEKIHIKSNPHMTSVAREASIDGCGAEGVLEAPTWHNNDYQNEIVRLQQKMARLQGKVTHLQSRVTHLQSQ